MGKLAQGEEIPASVDSSACRSIATIGGYPPLVKTPRMSYYRHMGNVTALHTAEGDPAFHTGDRIRKVREMLGYDTRKGDFARAIGVDRGSLAKYESTGEVKSIVIDALCNRTGARYQWIAYGKGPIFEETGPRKLPDHDSNVEPAGFKPRLISSVVEDMFAPFTGHTAQVIQFPQVPKRGSRTLSPAK